MLAPSPPPSRLPLPLSSEVGGPAAGLSLRPFAPPLFPPPLTALPFRPPRPGLRARRATEEVPTRKEQVMTMPQDPKANDTAVQQRDSRPS